jgi:hypothetical protein
VKLTRPVQVKEGYWKTFMLYLYAGKYVRMCQKFYTQLFQILWNLWNLANISRKPRHFVISTYKSYLKCKNIKIHLFKKNVYFLKESTNFLVKYKVRLCQSDLHITMDVKQCECLKNCLCMAIRSGQSWQTMDPQFGRIE